MIDVDLALDEKCDNTINQLHELISELPPTAAFTRLRR
jgi:hypothetical protein